MDPEAVLATLLLALLWFIVMTCGGLLAP